MSDLSDKAAQLGQKASEEAQELTAGAKKLDSEAKDALASAAQSVKATVEAGENITCTRPVSRSATAWIEPGYGTCTILMSAIDLNSSAERCSALPAPYDP